jgi:hypothetical protein
MMTIFSLRVKENYINYSTNEIQDHDMRFLTALNPNPFLLFFHQEMWQTTGGLFFNYKISAHFRILFWYLHINL